MIEIAFAVFVGLVLFAAFGAQTATLLRVGAFVGLRRAWGPLGKLCRWLAGAAVALVAVVAVATWPKDLSSSPREVGTLFARPDGKVFAVARGQDDVAYQSGWHRASRAEIEAELVARDAERSAERQSNLLIAAVAAIVLGGGLMLIGAIFGRIQRAILEAEKTTPT
jgi:hypothetical protein